MLPRGLFALALAALWNPTPVAACGPGPQIQHVVITARPYSPMTAAQVIDALAACDPQKPCEAIAQLRAYGAAAMPELLAALRVDSAPQHQLLDLITRTKVSYVGVDLFEIARQMPYGREPGPVYELSVRLDPSVFRRLVKQFDRVVDDPDRWKLHALTGGFRAAPQQTLAWITRELPTTKHPLVMVDLARTIAVPSDKVAGLVGLSTDARTNHRLAAHAIWSNIRTDKMFDVLYAGLTSRDLAIRSDAKDFFRAELVPVPQRSRFLPIFEAMPRTLDLPAAQTLVALGSSDRAAFELVFAGLTDPDERVRRRGVNAAERYASYVAPGLRGELVRRVENAMAMTWRYGAEQFKRRLERALRDLRS